MSSTLLTFEDKYYEYGEKGIETKGLAIGGYESTFLADLVASYLFEKFSNKIKEVLWKGIYRDDGLLVFKGKKSLSDIKRWREDFQSRVNKIAGNEYLQFTCEIWMPNPRPSKYKKDYVSEIATKTFPYLDLEFIWNADGELEYQVHRKPNQQLKYLNKGGTHTNVTFNVILIGIFYRIAKLTSRTKKNAHMNIDERYQGHAKALSKARLAPKVYPTMNGIWKKADTSKIKKTQSGRREVEEKNVVRISV